MVVKVSRAVTCLGATLLCIRLAACGSPEPTVTRAFVSGRLCLSVAPAAPVFIDGLRIEGSEVDLTPGAHTVSAGLPGYEQVERTVTIVEGQTTNIELWLKDVTPPELALAVEVNGVDQALGEGAVLVRAGRFVQVSVTASDNDRVSGIAATLDERPIERTDAPALRVSWRPTAGDSTTHTLKIVAADPTGNASEATMVLQVIAPEPTATPTVSPAATPPPSPTSALSATPSATAAPSPSVQVRIGQLALLTYPYARYLHEETDPVTGSAYWALDRAAYSASNPRAEPKSYEIVELENEYLRLVFLPELGGRLYQCVFKPTGQSIFYNNPVIKPSYWGPLPRDRNWWLAVGGMEWALPVEEHGYEYGSPWAYSTRVDDGGGAIVLTPPAREGALRALIEVRLPASSASFEVRATLRNPTSSAVPYQFWTNAMLSPGSRSVTPALRFAFPGKSVTVHSTRDPSLPGQRAEMAWPVHSGRDLSEIGNWAGSFGAFATDPSAGWVGVYDSATQIGAVRVFDPATAPGVKLFGFGPGFLDAGSYTDDGSAYVELWGGPNRTFWPEDRRYLAPGESLSWTEVWVPVAGTGGLTGASERAAVFLGATPDAAQIGVVTVREEALVLTLEVGGVSVHSEALELKPGRPYRATVPAAAWQGRAGAMMVRLSEPSGSLILEAALENGRP